MLELQVISAAHDTAYILDIEFSDDHHESIDFSTFIFASRHPHYEKYKNMKEFLKFKIIDGNLIWGDYVMIFPIEDLYHNKIMKDK